MVWRPILVAFVLALLVRVAYLVMVVGLERPIPLHFDDGVYHVFAVSIASGHGMSSDGRPSAAVSPGYPAFIGACYALFGSRPPTPRLAQAVLGALTAALLVALAFELGLGSPAAWLAGLMAAFYPPAVYFTGRYFPMVLHGFLLTIAVTLFVRWGRHGGAGLAACGVTLGAAALVRSDSLLLLPLLAASSVLFHGWTRRALVAALVLLVCTGVLYGAWVVRNWRSLGVPVVTTTWASRARWEGNNPWSAGGAALEENLLARYGPSGYPPGLRADMREQLDGLREIGARSAGLSEVQVSEAYQRLMDRWRTRYPARYYANLLRKLWALASPWPEQGGQVVRSYRWGIAISSGSVLLLAVVGFAAARRRGPWRWVMMAVLIQVLLSTLILYGHPRLRFPAEMLFLPYAAYGLVRLLERVVPARQPSSSTFATR